MNGHVLDVAHLAPLVDELLLHDQRGGPDHAVGPVHAYERAHPLPPAGVEDVQQAGQVVDAHLGELAEGLGEPPAQVVPLQRADVHRVNPRFGGGAG